MGEHLIGEYLSELAAALAAGPGSARARAAIVRELGAGLDDAVAGLVDRGCPPGEAARRVVADFGAAPLVAAGFAPVLAAAQVHRCALRLLRTGPLVGTLWLATALLAVPLGPAARSPVTLTAVVLVALALLGTVPCTVFAAAVTGRGARWWPVPPHRAVAAARLATGGAIAADLVMLAALGTQAPAVLAAPSAGGSTLAGLAALASLLRLTLTTRSALQLRRTRALLSP